MSIPRNDFSLSLTIKKIIIRLIIPIVIRYHYTTKDLNFRNDELDLDTTNYNVAIKELFLPSQARK